MRLFNSGRIYNFMGMRKIFIPLSLTFVLLSLGLLIFGKPNLGTDFVGGTEIELAFKGHLEAGEVRTAVEQVGFESPDVIKVDDPKKLDGVTVGKKVDVEFTQKNKDYIITSIK